eukprot:29683-Pelagococcus_subviridis.AAC.1
MMNGCRHTAFMIELSRVTCSVSLMSRICALSMIFTATATYGFSLSCTPALLKFGFQHLYTEPVRPTPSCFTNVYPSNGSFAASAVSAESNAWYSSDDIPSALSGGAEYVEYFARAGDIPPVRIPEMFVADFTLLSLPDPVLNDDPPWTLPPRSILFVPSRTESSKSSAYSVFAPCRDCSGPDSGIFDFFPLIFAPRLFFSEEKSDFFFFFVVSGIKSAFGSYRSTFGGSLPSKDDGVSENRDFVPYPAPGVDAATEDGDPISLPSSEEISEFGDGLFKIRGLEMSEVSYMPPCASFDEREDSDAFTFDSPVFQFLFASFRDFSHRNDSNESKLSPHKLSRSPLVTSSNTACVLHTYECPSLSSSNFSLSARAYISGDIKKSFPNVSPPLSVFFFSLLCSGTTSTSPSKTTCNALDIVPNSSFVPGGIATDALHN